MSEISVVMSSYNESEKHLRKAIESILNQTYKDFEIIIILDNPKNSLHKNVINEDASQDDRIHFHIYEKYLGLTAILNKALKLVSSPYIARMDADNISMPNRFEIELNLLKEKELDLVGGNSKVIDEEDNEMYSEDNIPTD